MDKMELEKPDNSKLTIDRYNTVSVIGNGSYAKVLLVKDKYTNEYFALKILKKEHVEKRKQEDKVLVERNILVDIDHPFIIHFKGSFQTLKKLYFVLEYCPGGELFNLISKRKRFSEDQARFYAAQMVLALEHLHEKNIIYRDLKPENVLIDRKGYIRITDFGLSRIDNSNSNDAKSICGTPEYLAPEIILKLGYGKAVDWWTLGSIIYEMLIGLPPFYTNDRQQLFDKIKFASPAYPAFLSPKAKNLLESLLKKTADKRLGYDSNNPVRNHPWFEDVNWNALLEMRYDAPFVPRINDDNDLQNFDPDFTEMPVNSMSMGESNNRQFRNYEGFTYEDEKAKALQANDAGLQMDLE
jgi:serum/glucocorticoid-regulated kinase 2